jgi:hypothetical protein
MQKNSITIISIVFLLGAVLLLSCSGQLLPFRHIEGKVLKLDDGSPVEGAIVTIRATTHRTTTDPDGSFSLPALKSEGDVEVTAWAPGYYIAYVLTSSPAEDLLLELRPYHTSDHAEYEWLDPTPSDEVDAACGNCHPMILPQWTGNAHGGAISNDRFFSFYNGSTLSGEREALPGYLADFTGTSGNCATCHAPGAAVDAPFDTDMNAVRDQTTAGIHCDFCHKVGGAYLNPRDDFPYENMPGVFSLLLLRPPQDDQIFIGPYPDIHDPDTYLPQMSESQFCAACHQFSFWGTPIYQSYREWLESSYSEEGTTCQACHMPPSGDLHFASPDVGGLEHPAESIPSHFQLGLKDEAFMQETVDLEVAVEEGDNRIQVTVTLTNTGAGHHVPTDHPGRNMLLLVEAFDSDGGELELLDGGRVPTWGGDYAGQPGSGYAKVLRDVETGETPVVSYWKQTLIESDNRIAANASDKKVYTFQAPTGAALAGSYKVEVWLIFRRLYQELAERYEWDVEDILIAHEEIDG